MPFYSEGVMRNGIQIVADIIFDDDCLLYLCTPGMGVNLQKARASPLPARPAAAAKAALAEEA